MWGGLWLQNFNVLLSLSGEKNNRCFAHEHFACTWEWRLEKACLLILLEKHLIILHQFQGQNKSSRHTNIYRFPRFLRITALGFGYWSDTCVFTSRAVWRWPRTALCSGVSPSLERKSIWAPPSTSTRMASPPLGSHCTARDRGVSARKKNTPHSYSFKKKKKDCFGATGTTIKWQKLEVLRAQH